MYSAIHKKTDAELSAASNYYALMICLRKHVRNEEERFLPAT